MIRSWADTTYLRYIHTPLHEWSHKCLITRRVTFSEIIRYVMNQFIPINPKKICLLLSIIHWNFMSRASDCVGLIVWSNSPWAVWLSIIKGVGSCWWPVSLSATWIVMAALTFKCTVPTSASAAEDVIHFIAWHSVRIGPFGIGLGIRVVSLICLNRNVQLIG